MSEPSASVALRDAFGVAKSWELLAACMTSGAPEPGVFFPERRPGINNHGREAKAVCASCPVVAECLVDALDRREKFGIRGGAGEQTRRALARWWRQKAHVGYVDGCDCPSCEGITAHLDALAAGITARLDANGPDATHGLRVTYARGCRCATCSLAASVDGAEAKMAAREAAA